MSEPNVVGFIEVDETEGTDLVATLDALHASPAPSRWTATGELPIQTTVVSANIPRITQDLRAELGRDFNRRHVHR